MRCRCDRDGEAFATDQKRRETNQTRFNDRKQYDEWEHRVR